MAGVIGRLAWENSAPPQFTANQGVLVSNPDSFGGHHPTISLSSGQMPAGIQDGDLLLVTFLIDDNITITGAPAPWSALNTAVAGVLHAYTWKATYRAADLPYTLTVSDGTTAYRAMGELAFYRSVTLHEHGLQVDTNTTPPWPQAQIATALSSYRLAGSWTMIDPGGTNLAGPATQRAPTSGGFSSASGGGAGSSVTSDEAATSATTPSYAATNFGGTSNAEGVAAATFVLDPF